jgi:hypothetical protein
MTNSNIHNTPELKEFIREQSNLFWYTPEDQKEDISPELLVETILNYGDMDAVRKLFRIMGLKSVATVFFNAVNLSNRQKGNYHELTLNYFSILFKRYA